MRPPAEPQGWLVRTEGGWLLTIWAQPGARRTAPAGVIEGRLKIRLAAAPVDGKANDALLRWLADRLDLPLRALALTSGQTSRHKRVRIACELSGEAIAARLGVDD